MEILVKPTPSMIPHRQLMENVGFTNISNTCHEFGKTSRAGAIVSGIMDIATLSMIPHRQIMENVDFTNTFHEFGKTSGAGAIVSGIMDIVGNVAKTNPDKSWKMLALPNISNNFH